jgi:hypothetical protein
VTRITRTLPDAVTTDQALHVCDWPHDTNCAAQITTDDLDGTRCTVCLSRDGLRALIDTLQQIDRAMADRLRGAG